MANGLDHTDEYLRRLKEFSCELPSNYRVRCTDELLSHLARVLADDTVFLIVRELREIQDMTERAQFSGRQKFVDQQRSAKEDLLRKHRDIVSLNQNRVNSLQLVIDANEKELKKFEEQAKIALIQKDMNVVNELDQLVTQQQVTLEKAGVPGFFVTSDTEDVQLQMYLLTFISNLELMRSL